MVKSKQPRRKSKKVIVTVVIVLVLVLGGSLYWGLVSRHRNNSEQDQSTNASDKGINFNPPTPEEQQETQDHKGDLPAKDATNPTPPDGDKKQVVPVISYSSPSAVNAYVPGVFEDGGTCTATYTLGSEEHTQTESGFKNASYTQCTPFDPSKLNLGPGVWSLTVDYSSNAAQGASEQATIKI